MPSTSIPQNKTQVVNIEIMTSIAGAPAQLDTTSNVSCFITQGAGIVNVSPAANTPTQARQFTILPLAVGPFLLTFAGPNGSQDTVSGSVTAVPSSSTLVVTLNPPE